MYEVRSLPTSRWLRVSMRCTQILYKYNLADVDYAYRPILQYEYTFTRIVGL